MNDQPEPFFAPPEEPSGRQRNTLLWVAIALSGLVLVFVCSLGGLLAVLFFNGTFTRLGDFGTRIEESFQIEETTPEARPSIPQAGAATPRVGPSAPQDDNAPPESPRPADETIPPGPVLIEETFDEPTTRWDQSLNRVVNGTYELRVDTPNYDSYGLFLGASRVGDFDMAVDVQQVAGSPTSEYGIRFRQSGPGDYLMFSISGSGYYRLLRVSDNTYQSLVPWTRDERIATGPDAVNRLRVVARGPALRAFINDQEVIEATDEVGAVGQLTLGVTTFDEGGLVVRFDNIAGEAEGIDLREDFSDPEATLWSIGGATIEEGTYELFAGGGIQLWQQPLPPGSSEVEHFVLQVDATFVNGPQQDEAYGVMFGDGGSFDFFSLFLFADGRVGLFVSDGTGNSGPLIPPTEFAAINTGIGATNSIRVEVTDNIISIAINDEPLPEVESPFLVRGEAGVIVSSGETGSIQVRFDNFRLREIPAGQQQA